jgi:hypothetical protein
MKSDDFRRAVTNGLGRAVLWLREHPWQPHVDAIEHVCLHNTAYDPQCEGSRAEYVYEIIALTKYSDHFAEVAANGLLRIKEYWDADHLFRLNRLLAQAGHSIARKAMYEKFEQNDVAEHFVGAYELVELDRLDGLLFVMERIARWMETHPEYWEDDELLRRAQEEIGPEVIAAVSDAAQGNPKIRTYLDAVEKCKRERADGQPRRPDYRKFMYAEMREKILEMRGDVPRLWPPGWGKGASEEAIHQAAADLLNEQDDQLLLAYLRMFHHRAFPLDPGTLVQLATSDNNDVARASRLALRHVQNSQVRDLALCLIRGSKADGGDAVELLEKNWVTGDHLLIESALDSRTNEDDFHWTAHAAVRVFQANPQAPALACLLKIYENCRCSLCREGAVKIMVDRRIIPPAILEECKYDSLEGTREIASTAT